MKHGQMMKKALLDAGVRLWSKDPSLLNARNMAALVGLKTHQAVMHHFKGANIRDEVAKHAVLVGNVKIVAQLIGEGHYAVSQMPKSRKLVFLKTAGVL